MSNINEYIKQFKDEPIPQDFAFMIPAHTPVEIDEMNSPYAQFMRKSGDQLRASVFSTSMDIERSLAFISAMKLKEDGTYQINFEITLKLLKKTMGSVVKYFEDNFPWNDIEKKGFSEKHQLIEELNAVTEFRNRFAHDLFGIIPYRESYSNPYLLVLSGSKGIRLVDENWIQENFIKFELVKKKIQELEYLTGRLKSA